ncbi:hypothetical protein FRACYDRAFT_221095, partial [Fragilariopsis cylindrus CCMP1102]
MSMSDCESSLSVFETPNCNFSANPFNLAVMPLAPRPSKKLLSKRIFLDLENNHFAPAFPSSPRSKKAKKTSSAFIRHESSSTEFRTSLIRLLNGESLQRLKEERAAAAAVSELYDDASVDTTISDNDEAIQSAALLFPASSISAGSRRRASSYKEKESSTGKHDTVVLGRRIQRRSSGIAR